VSNTLNLDAKRAARAAARGEPMRMVLSGETFDLVPEMPIEIGELANDNRIGEAFKLMLAAPEEDWDRLKTCRPSFNDILDVVEFYGNQLGESVKSAESSANTGARSKPTSHDSTTAISQAVSTETPALTPAG
jgi:hypothetical protein